MRPVILNLRKQKLRGQVLLVIGDNRKGFDTPTIVKSRPIASPNHSVLFPLNADRHFKPMHDVAAADVPFEKKAARIVWRGGTTGRLLGAPEQVGSRVHVFNWIDRHPRIDVGFSHKTPAVAAATGETLQRLEGALRPPMTQAEQLRSRYLLSLGG